MDAALGTIKAMQPDQTKNRGGLERSCGPMPLPDTLAAQNGAALTHGGKTINVSATITKADAAQGALPQHSKPPQLDGWATEPERNSEADVL